MSPATWRPSRQAVFIGSLPDTDKMRLSLRVPWQEVQEARRDYLKWHEFICWVYGILEIERAVPKWMDPLLDEHAPGILDLLSPESPRYKKRKRITLLTIWHELYEWVRQNAFSKAATEGWFESIHRPFDDDLVYTRIAAYSDYCRRRWQRRRPIVYPTPAQWRRAAERCNLKIVERFCSSPERRRLLAASRRIGRKRLAAAVETYIDWLAFAYWTRSAFRLVGGLPPRVTNQLKHRCPGFAEDDLLFCKTITPSQYGLRWLRLVDWIHNHFFGDAKRSRWLNLLVFSARLEARAERTMLYWADWDRDWRPHSNLEYPPFENWRRAADRYVFPPQVSQP